MSGERVEALTREIWLVTPWRTRETESAWAGAECRVGRAPERRDPFTDLVVHVEILQWVTSFPI